MPDLHGVDELKETQMLPTTEPQQSRLSVAQTTATSNSPVTYGLGAFGLEAVYTVFSGFYMFYYIDTLGLAVAMAAIINVVYGFWDAVDDPVAGFLSDNTRTRWGRRKPWLLTGLPFYVGLLVLVYAVPQPFLRGNALFWYALVVFLLFEAARTVMSVNYAALFPELFQSLRERARASSYYGALATLGELLGFTIPPIIYATWGFGPMAIGFAGAAGITMFLGIIRNTEDRNAMNAPPLGLKDAFGEVLRERHFVLFTIAATFLVFTTGVYTLATPFWVKYTLRAGPQVTSLIFAIVFITAILSIPLWSRFVRMRGIKRAWLWTVAVMSASALIIGSASNLVLGGIGAAVAGASLGGMKVCREIIVANFVDRSLERTGHRREGIFYSLLRVIGKFSKILESIALVILSLLFGYVNGEQPGPQPENAFRFLMSVFPLVFTFIAWLIASRLPFENEDLTSHPG